MERSRALLQRHQATIIKDLDVTFILDDIFTKDVITREDFDHIYTLTSRIDRARYLLEVIKNGDSASYQVFVDSLEKDYFWLSELLKLNVEDPVMNSSFEDSLSRGDVPRLPGHYVRRNTVENELTEKLKLLHRHKILVLHGMTGSGKTSVVVSVLRENPDLITNDFNSMVFWLNFGNCKTDDDIIAQQTKLQRKASSIYRYNSMMNSSISMSSIGSNVDNQSMYSDWTWQELKDKLKAQFAEPTLKESLLVLDEVNEKKVLEAFDIGCKILVTTRDAAVVATVQPQIMKIDNQLEEAESLQIFASFLEMEVSQLPRQAKKLHEICKGSPFHIALIGARLADDKDRLIHHPQQWKYYVKQLENRGFLFSPKNNNYAKKTVEVCINLLEPNILPLFKMLTVLPHNVKISTKVLTRLWNKDILEVDDIMKQLRYKLLINQYYDQDKNDYMYEIHDLMMDYLRTCAPEEELKKLHADFLKSYSYDSNHAPLDIVDDGYIAFYIGYHLMNTKNFNNVWSLFGKLFLNLKFLGNKVRLTGPADVILDLQKYENQICEDELDQNLVLAIKAYLCTHGIDLYRYPSTDILQSILQHESKGILFTKASIMAKENNEKNELYFEFLHQQDAEDIKHSTIDVKESITSVCFLNDYVVIGTSTGVIKFFHISTFKLKKELPSGGSPIKWIGACPINTPILASLTYHGQIKIWYIDDIEQYDSDERIEEESEDTHNNNYANCVLIEPKMGLFLNCRWAENKETLIAHTNKMIILYDPTGNVIKVLDNFEKDKEVLCCVPYNDNYVIAAVANSTHSLEVFNLATKEKVMSFEEADAVTNILIVPESNRIITLKHNAIVEHEFKITSNSFTNYKYCKSNMILASEHVKEKLIFVTAAVNKTGTLLFVSTDDSRVICIDLKTKKRAFDLENRRGNVVSMAVSEVSSWDDFVSGPDVLLTGTDVTESSAKVWYLYASYVSQTTHRNRKIRLTTKFDVSFANTHSPRTPISPAIPPDNGSQSLSSTPRRHKSFMNYKEVEKKVAKKTMSLDRHSLKPLNLTGIANGNCDEDIQPLLAVVDDKGNIQIMRGRKILTEIPGKFDEEITTVKISPCNHYVFYGLQSGQVKKCTLRTKETKVILDVNSSVQYLNFVNPNLVIVAGKNRCLMAYRLTKEGVWKTEMMQRGNTDLGSQEMLNDMHGVKKRYNSDRLSSSSSETSLSSKDRQFPNWDFKGKLCESSTLVACFWIPDTGLITVEYNATIKFWDQQLVLVSVLKGRQTDMSVSCAAFQKNVLVICDHGYSFQTFELKMNNHIELHKQQKLRLKLDKRIVACDLTADGVVLALGLDSGDVVVWYVPGKREFCTLKHHTTKVQWCSFSPVPDRLFRSGAVQTPGAPFLSANTMANISVDDEQPPLVLVTMASEIVWWDISHLIKTRPRPKSRNSVTPLGSPLEVRNDIAGGMEGLSSKSPPNIFFGADCLTRERWKTNWKGKTYKEGSKKKEILACIKLSGVNAKKVCHDDPFSCFVTVDNAGHVHIMNIMPHKST